MNAAHSSGSLRQHADPCAGVFAALGVVGGERRHPVRVCGVPGHLGRVELVDRHREVVGVSADLRQAGEPGVAVEGGVLDALRHHHPAGLLKADGGRVPRIAERVDELLEGAGEVGPPGAGLRDGGREVLRAER